MKKILLFVISFVFLVILNGCSKTNTPVGKVEQFLGAYNTLSDNVMADMESSILGEGLSTENQEEYRKVLKRQYQDLKYSIKDETIDGDNAVVTVKLTVYDLYKSDQTSLDYLNNNRDEFYVDDMLDQDLYDTYRIKNMFNMKETVEYEVDFYLTKKNGTWVLQNPDSNTLEKIHGLYNYEA